MAENQTQNNISKGLQDGNTQENPMKAVKTTSLPVKHEFSSDQSAKNAEKRNNGEK